MKEIKQLSGLYSLSKTLKFELKPIGKTLENIEKKGLLSSDEKRSEEYVVAKKIIDSFHKSFIRKSLGNLKLQLNSIDALNSLEEYLEFASKTKRTESEEKFFDRIKSNLRKQIVEAFEKEETFNDLFKKELIQKHLPQFVSEQEEKQIIDNFYKYTTYFTGFHENRRNMYSQEDKSTAIAYRIIHENLPLFIDNMKSFEKISKSKVSESFKEIEYSFDDCLNGYPINTMFELGYFSETLTQDQISLYNSIVGGKTEEDGKKIKGLNEYVNLYNQQHKDSRLPLLKPLYKMILSDRTTLSWLVEDFSSDDELIHAINEMQLSLHNLLFGEGADCLKYILTHIDDYDIEHIYISNDLGLTDISQQMFGHYDVFSNVIKKELRTQISPSPKEKREPELFNERINKLFKSAKSFSISYLNSVVDGEEKLQSYFAKLGSVEGNDEQGINIFTRIELASLSAKDVLAGKYSNLNQSEKATTQIKDLLDAYKSLQQFIKPLLGNGDEIDKDNEFDAIIRSAWNQLDVVTSIYNKARNWLTRKPYSEEKIKLNFDNSQLLGGWDANKEVDCTSVLLRKNGLYFLAIMDKKSNHSFSMESLPCEGECYEKIDYKLLPGANKMLPKVFFSKSRIDEFAPSSEIVNAYEKGTHKKGTNFSLHDCHRLIDFFKSSISKHEDWKKFPFCFSDTDSYEDISGFYREVEQQGYMLGFRNVSVSYIDRLVDEGKLYLFQIWSKDFSVHSKGTPNMHTLYWKMLFDDNNLADIVYKLNGGAEIFYRKRSLKIENTTVHKANYAIKNKNSQNQKKESCFNYDIVKDRRYTVDKFQFHIPITLNFKAAGGENINAEVQSVIRNNGIEHIIGIDRGERHLLYLSLIDLKGNIVKQMTLNDIINEYQGNVYMTNYHALLSSRETDRTEARRNWKNIETIKQLKEGYLSQVVHIIAKMMVDYKAIVVLEDLNMGFIRGRQKIERSVYEQFEKKLIDKLNYFVDKQKPAKEPSGILRALQLANKFESFKKMGKQCGCLFYIPAWNTSKMDPVTGFVKLLDTRYENVDSARCFFSKFDSIRFNETKEWFEFSFDYSNFTSKAEGTKTKWILCSYGTRIETFRNPEKLNQWDNKEVSLTGLFKRIFSEANIDIHSNLKDAICSISDKKTLESLMKAMKLLLQMRNSITNSDVDYLLSPVMDESGTFYDSRVCDDKLPKDADANGAYNIARKGLWVIRQIRNTVPESKLNLSISNKEWLQFVQEKQYLYD